MPLRADEISEVRAIVREMIAELADTKQPEEVPTVDLSDTTDDSTDMDFTPDFAPDENEEDENEL